ncbi:MAG: hypothetical protein AAFZ05_00685 [Pseudomonadota bacterium]
MKRITRRLKGRALEAFLTRAIESDIESHGGTRASAGRLAAALSREIAIARVRRDVEGRFWQRRAARENGATPDAATAPPATDATPSIEPPPAEPSASPEPAFDPYEVSLVPLFQKDGVDAVRAALDRVDGVDQLRKMARAQQLALPADIRRGEVTPNAVREAILISIERRIADRKAAAS